LRSVLCASMIPGSAMPHITATGLAAMTFVFPIPGRAAFLRSGKIDLVSHSSWWANAVHDCSLHSLV
jgi:hypothetical protein